ncbi:penicillin-binding protein 1A [Trichlorobacter ammonificans]|uniref:Penicillin-binding protein 1A n=1 Tax=Trichlorobacter ammonificans TaxID=2916410 RepID=A0ABM9D533_9BACT|nr:PBP1A family penicillin-binding protein [Trichlorobacter ammonificans]CAH2030339.1 Multimodular transpeptidase-transglycosylase [Trichlorobacter ammonificans]
MSHEQKTARRIPHQRRGFFSTLLLIVVTLVVVTLLGIGGYVAFLMAKLPKVDRLADYKPPVVSQVYGDDGTLVGEFYLERRIVVPVNRMPRKLIQAFVAAEDANFYSHKGIDYIGIVRAAFKNLITMRKKEGASTITQQVTKTMLLTPEKKLSRKIKEAILAKRMEERLTKDEILYLYLNQIYLGAGAYGVEAAAETYFGKSVDQLSLAEMAILAGLPKAPNAYSPIKNLARAKERQNYVLERMVAEGYITQAEAEHARKTPLTILPGRRAMNDQVAYFLEQMRIYLESRYGEDQLYKGGLKIYTTMNAAMQRAAYESVRAGLKAVDKRQGFRGALKYLKQEEVEGYCNKVEEGIDSAALKQGDTYTGVIVGINPSKGEALVRVGDRTGLLARKGMAWAGRLNLLNNYGKPDKPSKALPLGAVVEVQVVTPDVNRQGAVFELDQTPEVQGALVSIDPTTGGIKAMIGGYDFRKSQFNRAVQAKRNAGSAFKPIIYAAALEKGFTAATVIEDSEVEYPAGLGKTWKPRNYDNTYRGPVTMREALTQSINVVSVKILERIGVDYAVEFAKRLGFTSKIEPNLSLALGAASVSPLELTSAYTAFANKGVYLRPFSIVKVTDNAGTILEQRPAQVVPPPPPAVPTEAVDGQQPAVPAPPKQPALPSDGAPLVPPPSQATTPEVAYLITNLMESVVQSGTGHRAAAIKRPVAGKTGTTNEMKDAWFIGYVPQLVTGVWVGFDNQERSLGSGGSGGLAAAPIWADFMMKAVAGMPVQAFETPESVSMVRVNARSGKLARGSEGVQESFIKGTEPTAYEGE